MMEETTKISLESLQSELKTLQLDFIRIKNDWIAMENRLSEKLFEIMESKKQNKPSESRIGGFTVAELAKLKALGMLPKDLLSSWSVKQNEEAQEKQDGAGSLR